MNELLLYACMKTHAQNLWFETIQSWPKSSPGEDRNNEMIGNAYIFEERYLDSRRIRVAAARGLENLE